MKKIFVVFAILLSSLVMFSCGNKDLVMDNMSEITKTYFEGQDENNNIKVSISVGQRENPYIIDGFHQKTCDFSLVVLTLDNVSGNEITASIEINEIIQDINLYFDPRNNTYITDLGYALDEEDKVCIIYGDHKISLDNISKNFTVDYQKASDIASQKIASQIDEFYASGSFNAECYLKIFTKDNNMYWGFSIIGQNGKSYNVIINVYNEDIIISN